MIEVRLAERVTEIPEGQWDALLPAGSPPFVRHAFLDALERTGCVGAETGWFPAHVQLLERGNLVAVAPAYFKMNSEGEFVYDGSWAELAERMRLRYYPKLVVAVPFTPATSLRLLAPTEAERARLLPAFADAARTLIGRGGLSSVHVLFPTEPEAHGLEPLGFVPRHGVQFQWHNEGFTSFDDWLGVLSSKRRTQIRRERREIRRQQIRIETLRAGDVTEEALDAMYRFYVATVEKYPWGRQYLSRAFFFEIAERMPEALEIVLARSGSTPIAGALNFVSRDTLYGRYWGADEHRPFLHFEVCYYHSIDDAIARKLVRFEPGAGGDHKRVRGFRPTVTYSAHLLSHPRFDAVIRHHLALEREKIRQYVAGERRNSDE